MAAATVVLDSNFNVGPIDPRIFGGFLEHLGRAVYEGVYDPRSPHADESGFRRDVIDVLKALRMPVVRYPGGNFVSFYKWTDGIGLKGERPSRRDFAWRTIEPNQFGTDEFMEWCRQLGTEPMLAVNLGTAGPPEAADLVEYCNLPAGTYWSDARKANGHAEPHGVKLWCLGNEMDGLWQAGHVPADVYAQRASAASIMMKGMDRTIETIACGSSGRGMRTYMEWDRTVLDQCWNQIDFISAHRYSNNDAGDTPHFLAEGVEIDRILDDYAALIGYVRAQRRGRKTIHLSFDEWNVWYRERSGNGDWKQAPHLLEEQYNFEDALVCAQYLASFIRRADLVKVACIAQIVNVIAPVMTRRDRLLIQSIYHPFRMLAESMKGLSLTPVVSSPHYKAGDRGDVPVLDAAASFDPRNGKASVLVINRRSEQAVAVRFDDRMVTGIDDVEMMGGVRPKAANTWRKPDVVVPFRGRARLNQGAVRLTVPGPGLAVLRLSTKRR